MFFLDLWHSESYNGISVVIKQKENVSACQDYAGRCIAVAVKETQVGRRKPNQNAKQAIICCMNNNSRFLNSWHQLCPIAMLEAGGVGVGIAALVGVNLFPLSGRDNTFPHTAFPSNFT